MPIPSKQYFSSFSYLNVSQCLSAFNDNYYKMLVIYFLIELEGVNNSESVLAMASAIFVLPFLIFARIGGILADRFSKRNVIVMTRFAQLAVAIAAFLSLYTQSKTGCYVTLFALTTFSTIFIITRNSILPELVLSEHISKANGLMTSVGFLGVILGTFFASFILEFSGRNYVIAGLALILVAILSLLTSLFVEYTKPAGSPEKIKLFFLSEIFSSLQLAAKYPSLLPAVIGTATFYFFGAFFQLNIIPFAMQSLHLSDVQGGYLFLLTALGIGAGSILAGRISGKTVELGLVPVAGLGIALGCILMYFFAGSFATIIVLTIMLGLFGGMFDIPQETFIQTNSPANARGHIIAATNFASFFGVLCASGLLYLVSVVFGFSAAVGFLVLASIILLASAFLAIAYKDHLKSFIARMK